MRRKTYKGKNTLRRRNTIKRRKNTLRRKNTIKRRRKTKRRENKRNTLRRRKIMRGGGTVEQQHEFLNMAKEYNWTAVENKLTADPTLINVQPLNRWSALHQAANMGDRMGDIEAVNMLLKFGADPTVTTADSATPFDLTNNTIIKKVLLSSQELNEAYGEAYGKGPPLPKGFLKPTWEELNCKGKELVGMTVYLETYGVGDITEFKRSWDPRAVRSAKSTHTIQFLKDGASHRLKLARKENAGEGYHLWWVAEGQKELQERIVKLWECYNTGFAPPTWSKNTLDVITLGPECRLYCNSGDDIGNIKQLHKGREPVNIGMNRYYDTGKLNQHFGYSNGYYGVCPSSTTHGPWKPNILVYTPAYFLASGEHSDTHPNREKRYHILNVIGLAFDDTAQPDHMTLMSIDPPADKNAAVQIFYKLLFTNIFKVAEQLDKKNIVMSLFGCASFSAAYPVSLGGSQEITNIWIRAFDEAINETSTYSSENVYIMGGNSSVMSKDGGTPRFKRNLGFWYHSVGKSGNLQLQEPILDYEGDFLFINAWDCWTVPGNGNGRDPSLDGYLGRSTNIGVLGTPLTNPFFPEPFAL